MHIRPSFRRLCLAVTSNIIIFTGMATAFAVEILPPLTVMSEQELPEQLINNLLLLDQKALSVAHERNLNDVLTGFPGLSMTRAGGYGQSAAVFMRGAGGQGLVSLDGIPLLLTLPGFQNLDTLPTEAIQRAEIERGPNAASYPFQALGGAIRLYTQDRQNSGAGLSLEGGSFGILRETLQGGLSGKLGRITATLSRGDAFDGVHLAHAAENPGRDPFRFTQGIMRFSSDPDTRLHWEGSMLYRQSHTNTDNFGLDRQGRVAFQDDSRSFGEEETWLAQNALHFALASNWNSRLQLGYTQSATFAQAGPFQNGVFSRLFLADWRNRHALLDDEKRQIRWQWVWGGHGRHEQGESPFIGFTDERTMTAGFIETAAQYGDLSGEAGVRVEHFDRFGDHPLFKSAIAWRIVPDLTLRASGGTGYRIPSYTELLFLFFGNPNLQPERSASGDLGLEWRPVEGLRIAVNGYYNRYDDLITPVYDPQQLAITVNVADAVSTGTELSADYAWTDSLDSGLSYTYSDSRDLATDKLLPLRSPHSARLWGKLTLAQPVTLWAESVFRSAAWNDFANTLPIDASVQVNASVRYAVSKNIELYLRGENLTNSRTPQFYSTDMPGIGVYGGLQLEL